MSKSLGFAIGVLLLAGVTASAQPSGNRNRGNQQQTRVPRAARGGSIGDRNPLPLGDSGVAWYTTWKTGVAEAKRSNRPIFFMSAATTCSGVSGVF